MASGSFASGWNNYTRTLVTWSSRAGQGGSSVSASLYFETSNAYFQATNYNNSSLTIDGKTVSGSGQSLPSSRNSKSLFLSNSKWVSYTGNKSINIRGYIPALFISGVGNVGGGTASQNVGLDKVGSVPTMGAITSPTTSIVDETTSEITVQWNKASSYNGNCTYGIGVSVNGSAYSWVYPQNNINTTSYTYTLTNKEPGATYQFAVSAKNDVGWSNTVYSGVVTLNSVTSVVILTIDKYNPFVEHDLVVNVTGGSQGNGLPFKRMADLYYGDTKIISCVPPSDFNETVVFKYSTDNYLRLLGKNKYTDTFKIVAWAENANGTKSNITTKNFILDINTDNGAIPTISEPTLSGGLLGYPSTCFVYGVTDTTISSNGVHTRRALSDVTLSYKISCTGMQDIKNSVATFKGLTAGIKTVTVSVTDSRGLSNYYTVQFRVQQYAMPTIKAINGMRMTIPNTNGKVTYQLSYSPIYEYPSVEVQGKQLNSIVRQEYSLDKSEWKNYVSGQTITGLPIEKVISVYIRVNDKIKPNDFTIVSTYLGTIVVGLALRKNRIGINCVPQEGNALEIKGIVDIEGSLMLDKVNIGNKLKELETKINDILAGKSSVYIE